MIEKLANGDITKFDDIYKQNYILALNLMTYWLIRDEQIQKEQRINQIKNR
jgi:hypothetical protein